VQPPAGDVAAGNGQIRNRFAAEPTGKANDAPITLVDDVDPTLHGDW
jgi:hypothetical protein